MAYHSLTFGTGKTSVNTWEDWHIVPENRPTIATPAVKTNYVDIPGMDGSLDYTEALGSLKYKNREGSWTFYVMNDYGQKDYDYSVWHELYAAIVDTIHGKYLQLWSEDDPKYVYYGRFNVKEWDPEKDYSKVTIEYNLEPYKYKARIKEDGTIERDIDRSTAGYDWLWNDLFDVDIKYGKFEVKNKKTRVLYNDSEDEFEIAITVTSPMTVEFDEKEYELKNGKNKDSGVVLKPGVNRMVFVGNGLVTIDYDKDGVIL